LVKRTKYGIPHYAGFCSFEIPNLLCDNR